MILLFLLALQAPVPPELRERFELDRPLTLPAAVEEWKREIEGRLFDQIPLVRIPGDAIPPEDLAVLRPSLVNPNFLANFERTQAMTLRYTAGERRRTLVLLNLTMVTQGVEGIAPLVAHELGHVWLQTLGFVPLEFAPGPYGCLAIHATDLVQHVLIRREMDRRGIAWRPYFLRDYERALESLEKVHRKGDPPGDPCWRGQRLALMVDVRDTVAAKETPARDRYLEILAEQDPEAEALAIEFLEAFDGKIELEAGAYERAMRAAAEAMTRLTGLAVPGGPVVKGR